MAISNVSSPTPPLPVQQIKPTLAADGDSKVRTSHTSQSKDADGDYAQIKTGASPSSLSTGSTLAAISSLKQGG